MSSQKGKNIDKLAAVSVLLLPIPAKSPKEVVKISKIFKKNPDNKGKNCMLKHYLLTLILLGKL